MYRIKTVLPVVIALLLLVTACSGGANEAATQTAESEAATELAQRVEQTAQARLEIETQAAEDEAATAEAISEMETQTAIDAAAEAAKTATAEAVNAAATQRVEDQLAALDEILQDVGYSTSIGQLGWVQSGATPVKLTGGSTNTYVEAGGDREYSNFVIHFNATWDTEGWAGCGLIFRSEEDLRDGYQYIFNTLRFSGLPGWDVELWRYNAFISTTTGGTRFTNKIDVDNGATNNYILVADGSVLTVYIGGRRISSTTIASRTEGYFGYYAWQQSGVTTCTFDDVWIWELP